ncbi:hypothetical protein [Agromyces mangrovi Wang et al. 2018]|nr:hypothetical protein [Agromyces mangrovi]BDZ64130.1 hypothetical protein GCM10025877_10680 [Agromyces mangrovi]
MTNDLISPVADPELVVTDDGAILRRPVASTADAAEHGELVGA